MKVIVTHFLEADLNVSVLQGCSTLSVPRILQLQHRLQHRQTKAAVHPTRAKMEDIAVKTVEDLNAFVPQVLYILFVRLNVCHSRQI